MCLVTAKVQTSKSHQVYAPPPHASGQDALCLAIWLSDVFLIYIRSGIPCGSIQELRYVMNLQMFITSKEVDRHSTENNVDLTQCNYFV